MVPMRMHAVSVVQVVYVIFFLLPFGFQICADAAGIEDTKTGIVGTSGNDSIHSVQPVDVNAVLETPSDENVTTAATGIDGLAGDDQVTSTAAITTTASSTVDAPYVPLRLGGTISKSSSQGIYGGDGSDMLLNLASIVSTSMSHAEIMEVIMQIDLGITAFPTMAIANATGIEGGAGPDYIGNSSDLNATAIAETLVKEAQISAIEVPADTYGFGEGKTTATAIAVGIRGDTQTEPHVVVPGATEMITNNGSLSSLSSATSTTEQGMFELIGSARVDDSTIANAYSAGILGGVNDNFIINYQTIDSNAVSEADMTSVEIKMKGLMLKPALDLFGVDVGTFQTIADAAAVGIEGNAGDDAIINAGRDGAGLIDVYGRADADSQIFTFSISPPLSGGGGGQAAGALVAGALALPELATARASDDGSASAYGDASTVAVSDTAGILGGAGNDAITNYVALTSRAESEASNLTLSVDVGLSKESFMPLPGAAVADASTTAIATSRGIDGGTGQDTITNGSAVNALATADANSLGIAATIKGSMEGLAAGVAVTDTSSTSIAATQGIIGGVGGDTITNTGTGTITSTATSLDDSTSVSVTVAGDKVGVAAGVTLADAFARAASYSYGIDGEDAGGDESASVATQNDVIRNEGQIWSTANSTADANAVGVSVAASLEGISVSVALTEAEVDSEAYATGIRSGIGEDTIENTELGSIHATSTAASASKSVSVAVSGAWKGVAMGASYAEANTEATAGAVGIDSGDSNDVITNSAEIASSSTATVSSKVIAVTAAVAPKGFSAGVAFSETETNSHAEATGIDAGDGDDRVENAAGVLATSLATTKTKSVTIDVAVAGAAIADASSEAKAESTGLEGGAGVDALTNSGSVVATAASISDDTSSTFNLIGYASGDTESTSTAAATGMSGGNGTAGETIGDTLINASGASITAISDANAYVDDLTIEGGGVEFAKVGSKADSGATAMKGGVLGDIIENDGTTLSVANSDVQASSFSFNLAGAQLGSVGVNATGTAVGIDGGSGANTITNKRNGQIDTYADLNTTSLNTEVGVLSLQFIHSGVTANAYSQGILTGNDDDTIFNLGSINATANTLGEAGGASIGLISMSLVNAFASADIDGIYAGGGDDLITNEGTITAGQIRDGDSYLVKADTEAVSFDLVSLLLVSPGANADITGIAGGAGNDTISNIGTIFIGDQAENDSCTSSRSMVIGESYGYGGQILGASLAFAGSSARISSFGIEGGAGDDFLLNSEDGNITVKARSYADVDCVTYLPIGLLDTFAKSNAFSTAQASGLSGGDGADIIENHGAVTADALTVADADSYASVEILTNPHAISEAEATARAAGIDAGSQGSKEIRNFGLVTAVANAGARPYAISDSGVMNTYAEGYGLAESEAFGITSGGSSNIVRNHDTGRISVTALAGTYDTLGNTGYVACDEVAVSDAGYAWAPLTATGTGIALLDGNDLVVNDGSITVLSRAEGSIYTHTLNRSAVNANPDSDARSFVLGQAKGIAAGKGSNEVTNNGQLTVEASSYAAPKAYSWSSFVSTSAEAYGVSDAVAIGIEADGTITNSSSGILDITARAGSLVQAPTESESAKATALLNATATGFSTFTDRPLAELQRIINDGTATVHAFAGEDDDNYCAKVTTQLTSGAAKADANGILTVDAAGVRVGDGVKEIINTGTLNVVGQEDYRLADAVATSTFNRSTTIAYGKGTAMATGVLAAAGENHVYNIGAMDVNAVVDVYTRGHSDSSWASTYTTYATAETHAEAIAQGISVGSGDDEIINTGSLSVTSTAKATAYTRSDEVATSKAVSEAVALGIDGGAGRNTIINEGDLNVIARAYASASYDVDEVDDPHISWKTTTSATGIAVGDGGSYIRNSGAIDVRAYDYFNLSSHSVDAVGICGGSGDDTIINDGDIDTWWKLNYFILMPYADESGYGIGIDAGAGNDTVVLTDGSSINGAVYLGAGDDTLALTGSPVVEGQILPGTGTDAVLFDGPGFFGHNLEGFDIAMKEGPGTYTITGLTPVPTLEVREGTLEIDSDYAFSSSGSFSTVAKPDGSCGQLNIVGTGGLDGTLAVEREQGVYREGMAYDIITAETLDGSFSEVRLPESTSLLEFSMEQTSDCVEVSVAAHTFASVASSEAERNTGEYLDRIVPEATGDLSNLLGAFQASSSDKLGTAFASLSPASYDSLTTTTFDITSQYSQTLLKRMHSTRSHVESTDTALAYSQTERHAAWMDGFGHWANQDPQDGFAGYDYHLAGVALGADWLLKDGLLAGISYGQSDADIDMDNDLGKGDIESYFGSLYGSYFTDSMYFDTTLSYGRQRYKNTRKIEVGTLNQAAHSDHDGDVYSAYAEAGWNFSLKKWTLQPFAALRYTFLDEDSYEESGAEGINLRVEERKTDALVSDLGLRFAYPFQKDTWLCIPEATVAWNHDFDIDDRRIVAAFDGSPTTTFVTDGRPIDRDGLVLGAGLTLIRKNNLSLSVKYTGELRSHYEAHALAGGVRYEF